MIPADIRSLLDHVEAQYRAGRIEECIAAIEPWVKCIPTVTPATAEAETNRCLENPAYAARCWLAIALPRLRAEAAVAASKSAAGGHRAARGACGARYAVNGQGRGERVKKRKTSKTASAEKPGRPRLKIRWHFDDGDESLDLKTATHQLTRQFKDPDKAHAYWREYEALERRELHASGGKKSGEPKSRRALVIVRACAHQLQQASFEIPSKGTHGWRAKAIAILHSAAVPVYIDIKRKRLVTASFLRDHDNDLRVEIAKLRRK
ncbi:MAG: hypothetical protein GEV05_27375 [Betaproteobacteria bacterium]|nr:hypothetical protein [Betaproteobacteria bacterium]